MSENNLRRILKVPYVSIGSDSSCLADYGPLSQGRPHPRSFGTFPRVLGQYVREEGILSLGEAIHKMTYLSCRKLGISSRGRILEGQYADVVVFDPKTIRDTATYSQPFAYPEGIACVIVNGKVVVESGKHTGQTPGQILAKV
jgi:N-acyl-D-aspartate/D-glutamate deacylase